MLALHPLLAAITPLLLWPVELIFPYPHLVEELMKTFLVVPLLEHRRKLTQIKIVIFLGIIFAFSESVLYLFNIGDLTVFLKRLLITAPFHTFTFLLIFLPTLKNKKLLPLGTILAILVHFLYNFYIENHI